MSIVNRNVIRTVKNAAETTELTNDWNANPLAFNLLTTDFFYIGWRGRFTTRHFNLATANATTSVVTVEFWNGTEWEAVDDLIDGTNGFKQSGFISWELEAGKNWQKRNISPIDADKELYWVRLSVGTDLDAGTQLQSVLNLFTDDEFVRIYYPEFIANSAAWLPPGRTDFMDTHVGAKNLIITRLKQMKLIQDETEVIDVNQVAIAAAHAFAHVLLAPIAVSEDNQGLRDQAKEGLSFELSRTNIHVDSDEDGRIDEQEKRNTHGTLTRRGDDFSVRHRGSKLHG